jgi:ATP-dependent RNA helicase RhlE
VTNTDFRALGLSEPLLQALQAEKHSQPTPIQVKAIPVLLEGHDLLGIAQTGTGKTAAFALPILQRLSANTARRLPRSPRALVLAPTRELASQIDERFRAYGRGLNLRTAVIFGGVPQQRQVRALSQGVDILIATPGRLLDLHNQRQLKLDAVEILVLDEADRMLDMGFVHDVRKIVALCGTKRQSLLLSATMPPSIAKLAMEILKSPIRVEVTPETVAVDRIRQSVYFVAAQAKRTHLAGLLADKSMDRVLVFTRTKRGADRLCRHLSQAGFVTAAIHGNKAQNARSRALDGFRKGDTRILVATDIAARGIDIAGVTHVVNFELPNEPESYIHRIGRTARAGTDGSAISLCDASERPYLRAIERLMRRPVQVSGGDAGAMPPEPEAETVKRRRPKRGRRAERPLPVATRKPTSFSSLVNRIGS